MKLEIHEMIYFPVVSFFFVFLVWCLTKRSSKYSGQKNLPPSPRRLPILGNLHQLGIIYPRQNLQMLGQKHGPVMLLQLGRVNLVVLSSADAARQAFKTHDLAFANRPPLKRLGYKTSGAAFAPYGEYWRQGKKIYLLQLLSNRRVQSLHSVIADETALFIQKVTEYSSGPGPAAVNLSKMFAEFANDGICRSAFGSKYVGEPGKRDRLLDLTAEISEILGSVSVGEFIPWLSWMDRSMNERTDRLAKELDDFLEDLIQKRLDDQQDKNGDNFLDIMLQIYKGNSTDGLSMDRTTIKAMVLDIFAAGTDTTSTTLEWAMTELLRHPSVMENLRKEIREIVQDRQVLSFDDLEKMQYLKAVIKETLRYHPPLPSLIPRLASSDVNLMGYDIPEGAIVITNAWAIGRDPLYWDEPEKFHPERFFNSSIDFKGQDFELIPFGAGRKACPAVAFSSANMEFLLANLVQKFDWKLPYGEEGKDLDMSESRGITTHRVNPLLAIANQI